MEPHPHPPKNCRITHGRQVHASLTFNTVFHRFHTHPCRWVLLSPSYQGDTEAQRSTFLCPGSVPQPPSAWLRRGPEPTVGHFLHATRLGGGQCGRVLWARESRQRWGPREHPVEQGRTWRETQEASRLKPGCLRLLRPRCAVGEKQAVGRERAWTGARRASSAPWGSLGRGTGPGRMGGRGTPRSAGGGGGAPPSLPPHTLQPRR